MTSKYHLWKELTEQRDEARRWARIKYVEGKMLAKSLAQVQAENARLRARLQELTDSRQDAR